MLPGTNSGIDIDQTTTVDTVSLFQQQKLFLCRSPLVSLQILFHVTLTALVSQGTHTPYQKCITINLEAFMY